jgi:hypothetical protein
MVIIKTFKVRPVSRRQVELSWDFKKTRDTIDNYDVVIQHSSSPDGEFNNVSLKLTNKYYFLHDTVNLLSHWRKHYYRLMFIDIATGDRYYSEVYTIQYKPDLIALEIIRRNNLLLREFITPEDTIDTLMYIARTDGERCPECWDEIKSRIRTDNCSTCFGTGFTDGFYPPIASRINLSPSPEMVALTRWSELQPAETNAWMSNYPLMSPRDIIVETGADRRWRVVHVQKTEKKRHVVHQILRLHLINPNDVEYKIDRTSEELEHGLTVVEDDCGVYIVEPEVFEG